MVSAVPAGEVIARGDVFGTVSPSAARIGTTIMSGVAKHSGYNRGRQFVLMALIPPGEVFCISALTLEPVHQFQCDAFTDCVIAQIDPEQFVDAMLGVPLIDFQTVMSMVASRSREIMARYSTMLRLPIRDRLLTVFAELSSKLGIQHDQGTLVNIPLTHQDLADLTGTTRPIITSQLRDLERDGAIIRERRRLILVPQKLSNEGSIDPQPAVFLPSPPIGIGKATMSTSKNTLARRRQPSLEKISNRP